MRRWGAVTGGGGGWVQCRRCCTANSTWLAACKHIPAVLELRLLPTPPGRQKKTAVNPVPVAGTFDLVTETDKQCEAVVYSRLSAAFPAHKFIGEEGSSAQVRSVALPAG